MAFQDFELTEINVTLVKEPVASIEENLRLAAMAIPLTLLIASAILGNILVCVAIATDRNLRKLSHLFFVSMALADLLVATVVMPFALINDISGTWSFGGSFCKLWIATDVMSSTASIANLLAISLDRYIHIKDPLQYTEWITRKSVPISIGLIWTTSAAISFFPIGLDLHMPSQTWPNGSIREDMVSTAEAQETCQLDFSPVYSITSSLISFFLPCVIMVIVYIYLFRIARKHVNSMNAHRRPLLVRISTRLQNHGKANAKTAENNATPASAAIVSAHGAPSSTSPLTVNLHKVDSPLLQEHKAAITIGIIMGIFLLCWTPFFVVNVIYGMCKDCVTPITFKVLTWLGYSNSAFNPIIYSIFNADFRNAFHRIITLKQDNCFNGYGNHSRILLANSVIDNRHRQRNAQHL